MGFDKGVAIPSGCLGHAAETVRAVNTTRLMDIHDGQMWIEFSLDELNWKACEEALW